MRRAQKQEILDLLRRAWSDIPLGDRSALLVDQARCLVESIPPEEGMSDLVSAGQRLIQHWEGRDCGAAWFTEFKASVAKAMRG